jgi:hypothetical protein
VNRLFPALRPPSFLSAENAATRIQHAWKKKKSTSASKVSPNKLKRGGFFSFGRKSNTKRE